jgi:hypothetical protein
MIEVTREDMSVARALPLHEEMSVRLDVSASEAFAYLDDHRRFSSHMSQSSWRMGGARMEIVLDEQRGQAVGSRIRLTGRVLGIKLRVEEVVTQRLAPFHKQWSTIGNPRLLVIGHYRMGFDVTDESGQARVRIFIDYEPSSSIFLKPICRPLARMYAEWCVKQMAHDARGYFEREGMARSTSSPES